MIDPDNKEYVSSVECISAGGRDIPSMLILSGKQVLERWAANNLDGDTLFATSDSRYSNDDLAMDWLRHFDIHSRKGQMGAWRLLVMDGYGSHMTFEFYSYAQENHIELFRLPPHSTHLTQPLDVGCFQPFKHYHTEAIDQSVRNGESDFNKLNFLSIFSQFSKVFGSSHLLNQLYSQHSDLLA